MDHRKKYRSGLNQFGVSNFLSFSQSKSEKLEEPIPKKPKLKIGKNVSSPKLMNDVVTSKLNGKNWQDDIWGDDDDTNLGVILAQVEHDESIALSQMTQLTQSNLSTAVQINQKVGSNGVQIQQDSLVKRTAPSDGKNSSRVLLRRIGSSDWPSSSTFSSFHNSDVATNRKVPATADVLHTDLDQLRLENKKVKEELNKKAGEARILREKVNIAEKEKEKIKNEYSSKMDILKKEAERASSSFQREIRSLKGQLDVKNMELKSAERRTQIPACVKKIQPDSPSRLGASSSRSFQKENTLDRELDKSLVRAKTRSLPLKFIRESAIPELLKPSQPESVRTNDPRLFSGMVEAEGGNASTSKNQSSALRIDLRAPHTSLTRCAELLLSPSLVDVTSDLAQQDISQVIDICHQILTELLKQLESPMRSNNRFIERERELLMSGSRQLPLDRDYDLISHRELCSDERGIPARRALGLVSLLVQAFDYTAKKIVSSNSKESVEILETVRNIVRQIEKQRTTLVFQGVLAGAVDVAKNLLKADVTISKEIQTLIVDILRWVVSARPGSVVLRNILKTLLAAERYPHIIDSLCHNSAEKTYKENPRHFIIQFTPDSCILQVLCSLLKTAKTPRKYQLTDLLTLWVLSLFCGAQHRPQWLTAAPTSKSCQCHSLVCKLCFSLLSEACVTYPSAVGDDIQQLEEVLARGVLLFNTFMNDDEHLLAIVDPQSLGCYEHFLHFMGFAKIRLDSITRDILGFLCTQEAVLKQPAMSTNDVLNAQLQSSLNSFAVRQNGKDCLNALDTLESL